MRSYLVAIALLVTACSSSAGDPEAPSSSAATTTTSETRDEPPVPEGPLSPAVAETVERLLADVYTHEWDLDAIPDLAALGDVRTAWLLADLMRYHQSGRPSDLLVTAFRDLTGTDTYPEHVPFVWAMNELISDDVPAWDGYREAKARVYVPIEALWAEFFESPGDVDWRMVTWGGVLADNRPLDDNGPCNCIPALDHPPTVSATEGSFYPDDRVVFGLVVGDEAVALPKHQMEVHEMVHLTLGGRELGVPYCTLCGSAQAYLVDDVPGVDRLVLRTSGLLQRSNKLMYDLVTSSAIDTFTGEALTGPLYEAGVTLEQVTVVASTWGDWKAAHPGTRILAQDGGIGRVYNDDPLRGRDDDGPIFPIGDVDPRLPVQELVIGVIAPDGTAIAFPIAGLTRSLEEAGPLQHRGLTIRLEDGVRIYAGEEELPSHQSFWFAWSQFNPDTDLWAP